MKITAKYLTKVYANGTYALNDFSVQIASGDCVAVLGESGCGKTTLLRLLSGLEKPTAGELYFDDMLFSDIPIKERDTAVVFQEYILYPKMTVWENVAIALARYELPREEEERRVRKALEDFGLLKFRNQLPRVLSGGQQQRVALARAVVRNPSLLLFDEPLSNVAQEQRQEYLQLLIALKQKLPQSTFIYVTHNPREAMAFGKKLLIMQGGKVLQYGERERVWQNPYHAEVLRTLCGETVELSGKVEGGQFLADCGRVISVPDAKPQIKATVILNPYDHNAPCVFDEKGNAIQTAHERQMCFFSGHYNGDILTVGGKRYRMGEEFAKRFVGTAGEVKVGIPSLNLRTYRLFGDMELVAKRRDNLFTVGQDEFAVYGVTDFTGSFFVSPADIVLYENDRRVTAHYQVYQTEKNGVVQKGVLSLPCGKIPYNGPLKGAVVACLDGARVTPVKKGGIRAVCLMEEILGNEKLVYCAVKGWEHYVTFNASKADTFLDKKKLRLMIDEKTMMITDAR